MVTGLTHYAAASFVTPRSVIGPTLHPLLYLIHHGRNLRLVHAVEASKTQKREGDGGLAVSFFVVPICSCLLLFGVGGDLLSHNLPVAVPSACAGLASGFGMGPGVSLQLLTTDKHAKHKPLLFGCPPRGGCCVRYCIVDAVTTVTMFLYSLFLLLHQCVGVCCGQLVPVAFTPYSASRSGLSTLSSLGDLNETSS